MGMGPWSGWRRTLAGDGAHRQPAFLLVAGAGSADVGRHQCRAAFGKRRVALSNFCALHKDRQQFNLADLRFDERKRVTDP